MYNTLIISSMLNDENPIFSRAEPTASSSSRRAMTAPWGED